MRLPGIFEAVAEVAAVPSTVPIDIVDGMVIPSTAAAKLTMQASAMPKLRLRPNLTRLRKEIRE